MNRDVLNSDPRGCNQCSTKSRKTTIAAAASAACGCVGKKSENPAQPNFFVVCPRTRLTSYINEVSHVYVVYVCAFLRRSTNPTSARIDATPNKGAGTAAGVKYARFVHAGSSCSTEGTDCIATGTSARRVLPESKLSDPRMRRKIKYGEPPYPRALSTLRAGHRRVPRTRSSGAVNVVGASDADSGHPPPKCSVVWVSAQDPRWGYTRCCCWEV